MRTTKIDYDLYFAQVKKYVTDFFTKHNRKTLAYHNFTHTQNVVKRTIEIAAHYKISEEDFLILYTAAWFHDLGYLITDPEQHEEKSVDIFSKFALGTSLSQQMITEVIRSIMVTKIPRNPTTRNEEIICDADTFNLGTNEFSETNKLIFKEGHEISKEKLNKTDFLKGSLNFLKQHKFYTDYCNQLLSNGKRHNIKLVNAELQKENKQKINSKKS